ncbi:type VII secretion-associated serine protease mycosin [Kitasatospora sp. McL0602]|uniref:type VII secretion-associated serine protease mycosin n=1 Tax=Kitasatospora sp. McL0602 TaxID=3439530 RepID=UPI003F8CDE93
MVALAAAALWTGAAPSYGSANSGEWPLDQQHFRADDIWAISRGAGVTVAVVDSGVAASHPDLAGRVLPGTSLLGDGADGRADTSGDSHGTAIAGIIAGSGAAGAAAGMTGLAPEARILPVRVAEDAKVAPSAVAQGITWAVDHGAQVVNVSIGAAQPDPMLRQAVAYAIRKDVIVVASAGNQGEQGNPPQYPAAFPGVISVSGIDRNGKFWGPSESGAGVTLAAPASEIYSTNDQDAYVNADGTSYAAAYVSAAAALVRAHFPQLSAGQVIRRLTETASNHHQQRDAHLGYGIVNPLAALSSPVAPGTDRANPLLRPERAATDGGSAGWLRWTIGGVSGAAVVCVLLLLAGRSRRRSSGRVTQPTGGGAARPQRQRTSAPAPKSRQKPSKGRSRS